jgi:Ala-tRNA(Pro) deacylase
MVPASISGYLDRHHARYAVLTHPTAYTAQEEAAAASVAGNEWAKTVVCFADEQPVLAVLPAPFTLDLNRLKEALGAHSIRLAREQEFASLYADCEVGAMPPLGPLYGQRVVVDEHLLSDPEIVFSAGSHHDAIRMPFADFTRVAQPTPAPIAAALAMPASRTPDDSR